MKRVGINVFLMSMLLLPLAGNGQQDNSPASGSGNQNGSVERVVSLGPNITETVFALDRGQLLVGRTDYCDYPPEALEVESVGSLSDPSLEKIILLEPDLVIASTHVKEETLEILENAGIPVLSIYAEESFVGVYDLIKTVANALDTGDKGDELILSMKETVDKVRRSTAELPRPLVYYVIGYGEYGDYTAGGNTFIGKMIEMAGADNAAEDLEGWKFSLEELIKQNPDMLICSQYWNTREGLMDAAGYKELDAVRSGRIYTIDNNKLDRQGPRLAEGLMDLARIIHGDDLKN